MIGESSVCTLVLAKVGFFSLVRYELGIKAIMLLGKAEWTWAISNTCICRDDLQTSLTVGWLLMIFFTILTLAGDLLLRYASFYYSFCS
jgi:hypothetical protein